MSAAKTVFALFFGNRGFFPASLQAGARRELTARLRALGHKTISLDPKATRHGAVETSAEGKIYADFLNANRGKYGGIILSLPNFGDETGAITALKNAGVPILIQAYPDELDKMAPELRRDAFCGKISIMNLFTQQGVKFTALPPHTVSPASPRFAEQVDCFDRVCRVYNGLKNMVVGAIGARVTPFKTVRMDESALQRHGITVETLDISDVFARIRSLKDDDPKVMRKAKVLRKYSSWEGVPNSAFQTLAKAGVVLDTIVAEYGMQAVAIRCWTEFQQQMGVSPCVLMSEMNNRGIPAACEVDIGSAVTMYALQCASGESPICLDWNNNYEDEENKCILFHCGPVPQSLMKDKGRIAEHGILLQSVGKGRSYGCNVGRIAPIQFTFGNMLTSEGKLHFYFGQGRFTDDPIPNDFFGCAAVADIPNLQQVLQTIGYLGHRHHVTCTKGHVARSVQHALSYYLGHDAVVV